MKFFIKSMLIIIFMLIRSTNCVAAQATEIALKETPEYKELEKTAQVFKKNDKEKTIWESLENILVDWAIRVEQSSDKPSAIVGFIDYFRTKLPQAYFPSTLTTQNLVAVIGSPQLAVAKDSKGSLIGASNTQVVADDRGNPYQTLIKKDVDVNNKNKIFRRFTKDGKQEDRRAPYLRLTVGKGEDGKPSYIIVRDSFSSASLATKIAKPRLIDGSKDVFDVKYVVDEKIDPKLRLDTALEFSLQTLLDFVRIKGLLAGDHEAYQIIAGMRQIDKTPKGKIKIKDGVPLAKGIAGAWTYFIETEAYGQLMKHQGAVARGVGKLGGSDPRMQKVLELTASQLYVPSVEYLSKNLGSMTQGATALLGAVPGALSQTYGSFTGFFTSSGDNELHTAVRKNDNNKVDALTKQANFKELLKAQNGNGDTPLHLALSVLFKDLKDEGITSKHGIVDVLLDKSGDPNLLNKQNKQGDTPLHLALKGNFPYLYSDLLLQHGAKVTDQNNEGYTPVHLAAQFAQFDHLVALLKGLQIDAIRMVVTVPTGENTKFTPLHLVARELLSLPDEDKTRAKVARYLRQYGASVKVKDVQGFLPSDYAHNNDYDKTFEALHEDIDAVVETPEESLTMEDIFGQEEFKVEVSVTIGGKKITAHVIEEKIGDDLVKRMNNLAQEETERVFDELNKGYLERIADRFAAFNKIAVVEGYSLMQELYNYHQKSKLEFGLNLFIAYNERKIDVLKAPAITIALNKILDLIPHKTKNITIEKLIAAILEPVDKVEEKQPWYNFWTRKSIPEKFEDAPPMKGLYGALEFILQEYIDELKELHILNGDIKASKIIQLWGGMKESEDKGVVKKKLESIANYIAQEEYAGFFMRNKETIAPWVTSAWQWLTRDYKKEIKQEEERLRGLRKQELVKYDYKPGDSLEEKLRKDTEKELAKALIEKDIEREIEKWRKSNKIDEKIEEQKKVDYDELLKKVQSKYEGAVRLSKGLGGAAVVKGMKGVAKGASWLHSVTLQKVWNRLYHGNAAGNNALQTAILAGDSRKVDFLLDQQSNANELKDAINVTCGQNNQGNTPLHLAVQGITADNLADRVAILRSLLSAQYKDKKISLVLVDMPNNNGDTALHVAIKNNAPLEVIKMLLFDGRANPNIRNNDEKTPLHVVVENKTLLAGETPDQGDFRRAQVAWLLRTFGGNIYARDKTKKIPADYASDKRMLAALSKDKPKAPSEKEEPEEVPPIKEVVPVVMSNNVVSTTEKPVDELTMLQTALTTLNRKLIELATTLSDGKKAKT